MDQTVFNWILAGVSSVLGWFLRTLWEATQELKADLAKLREGLPKDYIARDDYREDIREIKTLLNKMYEKLDGKADKGHG